MLLTTLLLAAAAASPAASTPAPGTYLGQSSDHQLVRVKVRDGRVTRVDARAWRYVCTPEGNIGPYLMTVGADQPIVDGAFSFTVGPAQQRMRMTGTFGRKHTLTGAFRLSGTIGTGDPCVSPTRSFSAKRTVSSQGS